MSVPRPPAPHFLAVGPQRTGTTWLYQMLREHPRLCFPAGIKETMFFDRRYESGKDWYVRYFEHCEQGALCGEVAPTYFDNECAVERIHTLNPSCKVVVSVRDPVDRAFSLYLHHRAKGRVQGPLREAVAQMPRILDSGRYAQHLPRWVEVFGDENVLALQFEDMTRRPGSAFGRVWSFLGVAPITLPEHKVEEKVNVSTLPRFPLLARWAAAVVTRLHDYRLHGVVSLFKKIGFRRVYGGGGEKPKLSVEERAFLHERYAEDIAFVNRLFADAKGKEA